jgi:signal transduction histidine kinase/HAMP domain-containing protein
MRKFVTYLRSRIRFKIILPFAVLTIMVSATGVYLSTRLVSDSLEDRFTRQLVEAASVAADGLVQREQLQLSAFRAIAFTEGIGDAILSNDSEKLAALVFPHVVNNNVGFVQVVDTDGRQLLGVSRPPGTHSVEDYLKTDGADFSDWPVVQKVLSGVVDAQGDKHLDLTKVAGEGLFLTAGPVKQDSDVVGAVIVGTYTRDLMRSLSQATFSEITFYDRQGLLFDTTFPNSAETATTLVVDPQVRNLLAAEGGKSLNRNIELNTREYDLLFNVLRARGQPLGFYSVALQTTFIGLHGKAARNQMVLIFATSLLLVFGIGYLTANKITGRVQHLMENAIAVANGDFTRRTTIDSNDEIGMLANSLDHMTLSLANYTSALQNRIDELIALYDSSTAVTVKSGLNLDNVLHTVATSVRGVVRGTDQVIVYLLDTTDQALMPRASFPEKADELPMLPYAEQGEIRSHLDLVRPQVINKAEIRTYALRRFFSIKNISAAIIAPLVTGQEVLGMVILVPDDEHKSTDVLLDTDTERLLGTLVNQAAVAVKNAQLFEATQHAYEELRKIDDLKTKFINIAAHELRTPLGAMMGYSSFVEKRVRPELRSSTRFLVASTLRMRTMVDAMLAIQRLDAGTAFLRVDSVNIEDIITKTVAEFQPIADLEGHYIETDIPDELPPIKADSEKINLVLSNLLSNAIKFTPEGGQIEVSARDFIKGILVSVTDNGVGIDANEQSHVFERFYQVRPEHIAGHGGIGIGLTIVKHLVELHEGQVWVESTAGEGSTFYFTLPILETEGADDQAEDNTKPEPDLKRDRKFLMEIVSK